MSLSIQVRQELPADIVEIHALNAAAFGREAEAALVDRLRAVLVNPFISMVAEVDGRIVGHILFTPVVIAGQTSWQAMGLAPMSVLPEMQRRGIGTQLIREGLSACVKAGQNVIVVLGHPAYYPRFGFRRLREFGLTCEFEAPDDAMMIAELLPGAVSGRTGQIRYHPLFREV